MLFSKNYLFTCVFILCSIPHAVLKSTSLCDPQSDLLKTISLSVQRPTAFHHRAIELEHSLDHEVLSVSNTLSQKKNVILPCGGGSRWLCGHLIFAKKLHCMRFNRHGFCGSQSVC